MHVRFPYFLLIKVRCPYLESSPYPTPTVISVIFTLTYFDPPDKKKSFESTTQGETHGLKGVRIISCPVHELIKAEFDVIICVQIHKTNSHPCSALSSPPSNLHEKAKRNKIKKKTNFFHFFNFPELL